MEATYCEYDVTKSVERINEILDASDSVYEEKTSIPDRALLTFTNGFYVNSSAMFVDMRGSKDISSRVTKAVLAKIYKAYVSELVALMRSHSNVNEIYIEGDCVWGIFDTTLKSEVDELFNIAAKGCSLIAIINARLRRKGFPEIKIGIGLSYGTSLYVKAGHKGSGINEVIWVGELVAEAAKLCSYGSRMFSDHTVMASNVFKSNLKPEYQGLLSWNGSRECWHGSVHNKEMSSWAK